MANKGYFIITDISGYTEHLTKSELEHAYATLQGGYSRITEALAREPL